MNSAISPSLVTDTRPPAQVQTYARVAGLLMLLSIIFGFLGEWYLPSKFMSADAATTARNIVASEPLYRFAFAAYLVEAICDIALTLLFYVVLKPVSQTVALAAAFFGLVATATYGVAEMCYFVPLVLVSGGTYLKAFSADQVNAIVVLSLKLFNRFGMLFAAIYGIASILRGYLVVRSGFLPKFIGVLMILGGVGFIAKNVTIVLAPAYSSDFFLMAMFPAGLVLMLWMLVKGVDVAKWQARAAPVGAPS